MSKKYGIIDIGSNTIRLVIYVKDRSGRLKEIENIKAVARLRNYLMENGYLSQEGQRVLIETLKGFQEVTRFHQLKSVRCVATATVRQAVNQKEILRKIAEETDFHIRVLSEYEEAYYGFLAVVNSTSILEGITIDIGGGSTEITYFKNRRLVEFYSFPFGALSLKKQFVNGILPTEKELKAIQEFLQKEFDKLPWLKNKKLPIIAIGGSARNLVQVDQVLKKYPLSNLHQYQITLSDIVQVKEFLKLLSFENLQRVEGLSKDRADIIIPAIEVFEELYKTVDATSFLLSRKGLRDGVFYEELMQEFGITIFPNVIEESFQQLSADYEIDLAYSNHVTNIAISIFQQFKEKNIAEFDTSDIELVKSGSFLYNLGEYIDSESSSQHTFYLLANRTIEGLTHKSQVELALVGSFKNKTTFKQFIEPFKDWYTKEEQRKLRLIGALVKFAYSLNATKRNIVEHVEVAVGSDDTINISIYSNQNCQPEEYEAEKQKKHLEKVLKKKIELNFFSATKKAINPI